MTRRLTTASTVTAVTATAVLLLSTAAAAHNPGALISDGAYDNAKDTHAHEAQHDSAEGHLEPVSRNVTHISTTEMSQVTEGGIADLAVHKGYAYLNSWGGAGNCGRNGVHVVDMADLTKPVEVGFIQSKEGSYPGEGAQVISLRTPAFTGDVLLTNNEICKPGVGFGGINMYDVTNPREPVKLAVGFGDYTNAVGVAANNRKKFANQVHSVFAWQDGNKAYAVMVDNEENTDVDIVDITNPRKPVLIGDYDLVAESGGTIDQEDADLDEVFLHDMVVKEIDGKQVMLASYWDAGYVRLDVTDPVNPEVLADSDFDLPDDSIGVDLNGDGSFETPVAPEGNAHQAEFTRDNAYVIGADEDFSPYALTASNTTDKAPLSASPGSDTTPLETGRTLTGTAVYAGRACTSAETTPAPSGDGTYIAVIERGVCTFTEKVASVVAAGGYDAVLIFNRTDEDGCEASLGMSVEGSLPTFGVAPRSQGFAIFGQPYDEAACLAGDGTQLLDITLGALGDTLSFTSYFDGWGPVRLFDADTMGELDTYAIPESRNPAFAEGFGDLSVHEVATSTTTDSLAYLSYYAGGLRVIDVAGGEIREAAAFIDEGGNNFWGVETFLRGGVEYVALSDRDKGLYVLQYTPSATP